MGSADPDPHWLTADELDTWKALHLLLDALPTALSRQLKHDAGLSFVEYYVLASLSEQPGHALRLTNLAELANSQLSRLSHLITRLEKRGFVRRVPDPNDGRGMTAVLTPAGHAHLVVSAPGHVQCVRRLVFDPLGEEAQHALRDAARAILRRLDQSGPPP